MFIRRAVSQEDSIADRRIFVRTQQKGFRFQGEFLLNASRIQIFVAIKLNCGFTFYLIWNKCGNRERFTNQRSVGNCRGQENGSPINKRRGPLCGSTQKTVWFQDGQKEALFKFLNLICKPSEGTFGPWKKIQDLLNLDVRRRNVKVLEHTIIKDW